MSFKCLNSKVFVYFDTNRLRSVLDDKVVYEEFKLSRGFEEIESYLRRTGLLELVDLGISDISIKELQYQKYEQFNKHKKCINKYEEKVKEKYEKLIEYDNKLSRLTNKNYVQKFSLELCDYTFDCDTKIKEMSEMYFSDKNIEVLSLNDDTSKKAALLDKLVQRVVQKKPPFKVIKEKGSDIGFKDVLIWELLLNYENISSYDKVLFVTNDGIFKECVDDFTDTIGALFELCHDWEETIDVLENYFYEYLIQSPFFNYIENKRVFDVIYSEFYRNYIKEQIASIGQIKKGGNEISIEFSDFIDPCIEMNDCEWEEGEHKLVVSLVEIKYSISNDFEENCILKTETVMDDTGGTGYSFGLKLESLG